MQQGPRRIAKVSGENVSISHLLTRQPSGVASAKKVFFFFFFSYSFLRSGISYNTCHRRRLTYLVTGSTSSSSSSKGTQLYIIYMKSHLTFTFLTRKKNSLPLVFHISFHFFLFSFSWKGASSLAARWCRTTSPSRIFPLVEPPPFLMVSCVCVCARESAYMHKMISIWLCSQEERSVMLCYDDSKKERGKEEEKEEKRRMIFLFLLFKRSFYFFFNFFFSIFYDKMRWNGERKS